MKQSPRLQTHKCVSCGYVSPLRAWCVKHARRTRAEAGGAATEWPCALWASHGPWQAQASRLCCGNSTSAPGCCGSQGRCLGLRASSLDLPSGVVAWCLNGQTRPCYLLLQAHHSPHASGIWTHILSGLTTPRFLEFLQGAMPFPATRPLPTLK